MIKIEERSRVTRSRNTVRIVQIFLALNLFAATMAYCQEIVRVKVIDAQNQESLPGASVVFSEAKRGTSTNSEGVAEFKDLPAGPYELHVSYVGYHDSIGMVVIAYPQNDILVALQPAGEELEEVIVSSTRTNRRIEDLPLKVEVLGMEEMDEESALVPGNIASILGDLAVITVQRTNPVNGNDAIRMQGLDQQYTLLAKDGLPLYGGFSGSLGVLSIPPLDLKQVEIIKGSVSTLYGGGAIAGLINFISREPGEKPQRTILANVSTLKEKNLNTFFSGKLGAHTGYSIFTGINLKSAIDVNHDGFSEVPEHEDFIIHPRFFFSPNDRTKFNIGLTSTIDNRRTGDMVAVEGETSAQHPWLRTEKTSRHVLDMQFSRNISKANTFSVKTSLSYYARTLSQPVRFVPKFSFDGKQYSTYTEVSDRILIGKSTLVAGVTLITESMRKSSSDSVAFDNYDYITTGLFAQYDLELGPKTTLEAGIRVDHHNLKGTYPLYRLALFYRPDDHWSVRFAGGTGYKAPNVLALVDPNPTLINNIGSVASEESHGLNQAFYVAEIKNPIRVITDTLARASFMENQQYLTRTFGTDTYVQASYKRWELYLGYNHTNAFQHGVTLDNPMPFNPKDKFSTTLAYAVEGKWRAGVEGSYVANQYVYNSLYYYNSQTIFPSQAVPNFWFWAAMVERKFSFGSIVLNVENLFDARQSNFGPLFTGPVTSPTFRPVWGPLDGRVINLAVKVDF